MHIYASRIHEKINKYISNDENCFSFGISESLFQRGKPKRNDSRKKKNKQINAQQELTWNCSIAMVVDGLWTQFLIFRCFFFFFFSRFVRNSIERWLVRFASCHFSWFLHYSAATWSMLANFFFFWFLLRLILLRLVYGLWCNYSFIPFTI